MNRPVTQTLTEQLRSAISAHTIVVWLDKDEHYTRFVDALIPDAPGRIGAPALGYRGSYLELIRELAPLTSDVDPAPLLLHVPRANEESIKRTPLLETYDTGYRFRKALETLIREAAAGRVTSEEVDGFLAAGDVTLESADAWMARQVAAVSDATEVMLRGTDVGRLLEDLIGSKGPIDGEFGVDQLPAIWHYFATQTGLPERWPTPEQRARAQRVGSGGEQEAAAAKRRLADLVAAWVLSVEYVHDLQRPPEAELLLPAVGLPRHFVDACRAAAQHLRTVALDYYVGLADDVEDQLAVERDLGAADELGRVDTFRFEEDRLLLAALAALEAKQWSQAAIWATQRLTGKSVWLEIDAGRRRAWALVEHAARLGAAASGSTLSFRGAASLSEATRRYVEHGAAVDRVHRVFEQEIERHERVPHLERIRAAIDSARASWREWAEQRAQEWSRLCEDQGMLPPAGLQQRAVFEEVVEPLLGDGERTALFLVDGLRFEMAQELIELIGNQTATSVRLDARLAELPSVTEVGMNALAPTAVRGRLQPILNGNKRRFLGFDTGGFQVRNPEQRKTALARRAGGTQSKWFELEEVNGAADLSELRRKTSKSRLVVVHSIGIDKSGEAGNGPAVFASELRRIHTAWELLRAAGVRRFVFCSDHGFLLRRPEDPDVIQHGQGYDPLPRYVLYPSVVDNDRQLGVTLRKLGYDGVDGALLVPRGLAVFQPGRDRNFVHGGNSPQERVIPVLTIVHKQAVGGEDQHYRVEIRQETSGPATHGLSARVVRADNQTTLALSVDPIELELRAVAAEVVAEALECEGAKLESGLILARVGDEFRLRFRLTSPTERRVQVELFSAGAKRRVDPATSSARFVALAPSVASIAGIAGIAGTADIASDELEAQPGAAAPPAPAPAPAPEPEDWLDEFEDPGARKVIAHIAQHGEATENDLLALLGNNRKARKFAREFEAHAARAPFLIELSSGPAGKTYRKVTDK